MKGRKARQALRKRLAALGSDARESGWPWREFRGLRSAVVPLDLLDDLDAALEAIDRRKGKGRPATVSQFAARAVDYVEGGVSIDRVMEVAARFLRLDEKQLRSLRTATNRLLNERGVKVKDRQGKPVRPLHPGSGFVPPEN
jgi:hypothetical protein